jgi:hypothetical protein
MTRPKVSKTAKRHRLLSFRATDDEAALVKREAERLGVAQTDVVRMAFRARYASELERT